MEAIIIVGNTGRGKSTSARQLIKIAQKEKRNIFVYDPNNEYAEFYNKPFIDKKIFVDNVSKTKNSFILFEEATIFFSNRGNEEKLIDLLVRKRHTNNKIVLLFHSLRSIPTYILELCNFIILYKTTDRPEYTLKKFAGFDDILEAFEMVNELPDDNKHNFHFNYVVEINKPVSLL